MKAQGRATLDFGAHPGGPTASIVVSAPSIDSGDIPQAWLLAEATSDHTADEHTLEPIRITCSAPSAGVGFTVYGTAGEPSTTTFGAWRVAWRF